MATNFDNFKVVIIDSDSTDGSVEHIRSNYGAIELLKNEGKAGFAGGVNTGIRHALARGAEYIAIFNTDIRVVPSWIDLGLIGFSCAEAVGLVGFREVAKEHEATFYSDDTSERNVAFCPRNGVAGCLMLCSSSVFRRIGFLDEDFYMYGEDNDLFFRVHSAGFGIVESNIPVWHFGEGSSSNRSILPTWFAYRNALRFAIKNESAWRIGRMLLSLVNQGCRINVSRSRDDPSSRRLRRFGPLVSIVFILGSICWNIAHLFGTLRARGIARRTAQCAH